MRNIDNNELFEPSISEDFELTKTFNISRFYLVSFFLGVICIMLIGTCNAKWLKIKPSVIYGMIAVCILIFIGKYTAFFLARYGFLGLNISEHLNLIKNIGRTLYLLTGILYAFILKGAYKKHIYTVNTTEKMKPYLIRYAVLSLVIEAAIIIIIMI